jgi:predicted branched-subunit amino acid permease
VSLGPAAGGPGGVDDAPGAPADPGLPADPDAPVADPDGINARALSIGIAVGAYAVSFGAVSVAAGLDVLQAQALSALMFTGASQFAFVGVVAAGGGLAAAVVTAWLLGLRNGLYALHLSTVLSPVGHPTMRLRGWRRMGAAQFTIDESTAMALAYEGDPAATRRAFWATGWSVFVLWNLGTLLGAAGAASLSDPKVLGLDAAIPAGFLALLWPRLVDRSAWALAVASGGLALALAPVLRPGMPVLAGAGLAVAGALWLTRERA